jgi:hypothetical protein
MIMLNKSAPASLIVWHSNTIYNNEIKLFQKERFVGNETIITGGFINISCTWANMGAVANISGI